MRKMWKRAVATVQDRPARVSWALVAIVVVHAAVSRRWPWLSPWISYARPDADSAGTIASIYLGLAGMAALAAGFAGVVIVFGLDSKSERFLEFRDHANTQLHGNWTSIIASSFAAAGLALAAAALVPGRGVVVAPWLFELGCLTIVHAAVRMIWLLRVLMGVVKEEDREHRRQQRAKSLSDILGGP